MSFDELLIQTCDIQAHTQVTDSYGDSSLTWSNVSNGGTVPCRVQPNKASSFEIDGKMKVSKPPYTIYVKLVSGLTIAQGNKVIVSSLGQNFKVLQAKKDSSGHHWELDCEEFDFIQ